jgi:hypothetical protein
MEMIGQQQEQIEELQDTLQEVKSVYKLQLNQVVAELESYKGSAKNIHWGLGKATEQLMNIDQWVPVRSTADAASALKHLTAGDVVQVRQGPVQWGSNVQPLSGMARPDLTCPDLRLGIRLA